MIFCRKSPAGSAENIKTKKGKDVFCPECGKKNSDDAAFCAFCGARIIDSPDSGQPAPQEHDSVQTAPRPKRRLSKAAITVIIAVVAAVAVLGVLIGVGKFQTDPKNIVKNYFLAEVKGDWAKVYSYYNIENSGMTSKDSFVRFKNAAGNTMSGLTDFDIEEKPTGSGLVKQYDVKYASGKTQTVKLVKKSSKRYLFFDDYAVSTDNLVATDYTISTLKDSTVSLDGVKLRADVSTSSSSPMQTYKMDKLFAGTHQLAVENPMAETLNERINVSSGRTYSATSLKISGSVKSELAKKTYDYVTKVFECGIAGQSFDKIGITCTSDAAKLKSIQDEYASLASILKRSDGTGYKSVAFTSDSDISTQTAFGSDGTYACYLKTTYSYVRLTMDYATNTIKEVPSTTDSTITVRITYAYENGGWVVSSMYI